MTAGQAIIDSLNRAGPILTIEKVAEEEVRIVWHANAAEQIEAALRETGFTVKPL